MKVDHLCPNCGSKNIGVRSSDKVGILVVRALCFCNRCGTEIRILSEIVKVRTPIYQERPEALRVNKPLLQVDPNQLEISTD